MTKNRATPSEMLMSASPPRSRRRSNLLKLGQRAAEVFRMQEQHRLAVRPDLWVAVADHTRALRFELVARGQDVGHLVAHMMDAAVRVLLQELGDRAICAERLQELDLGVGQIDENDRDAVLGLRRRSGYFSAQSIAIDGGGGGEILHRDGDVIEASDHGLLRLGWNWVIARAEALKR